MWVLLLRSRHKDRIKCARDTLGKMPVKDKWGERVRVSGQRLQNASSLTPGKEKRKEGRQWRRSLRLQGKLRKSLPG